MDHASQHDDHPPPGPGYETKDASVRPVLFTGAAIVGVTALVFFVLWGMIVILEREKPVTPHVVEEEAKPEDNPFTNLYAQKAHLRKEEAETLSRYTYDAKSGVATLPIDRAMDLIAERGVPKGKGPKTEADVIRRGKPADEGKKDQ